MTRQHRIVVVAVMTWALAGLAHAQTDIPRMEERVSLHADGTADTTVTFEWAASYSMVLVLPPGFVVRGLSARDAADAGGTTVLGGLDGRHTATIGCPVPANGGRVVLDARAETPRRALPLSLLLGTLAAGYLYACRDLVAKGAP